MSGKARVWFYHPDRCWEVGTILGEASPSGGERLMIQPEAGDSAVNVPKAKVSLLLGAVDKDTSDDLLSLTELHPATLLSVIKNRFLKDVIYTYIGDLVIAVNPFKSTIPWYEDDQMSSYITEGERVIHSKPHSWCVAHNAFYSMLRTKSNQSIIISGESGAGKTEGCKIVMKYLCALSALRASDALKAQAAFINDRVQQTSPILEAFGNAKTVRNDNSSRFGKFMQAQFDGNGVLVGMRIVPYLLEKSRVIRAGPEERVYHAFYHLLASHNVALRDRLRLTHATKFRSVNSGRCLRVEGVHDAQEFNLVVQAMKTNGFSEEDQDFIWRVLAAILHLQNVEFVASKEDAGRATIVDTSKESMVFISRVLLCIDDADLFQKNFISSSNIIKGEVILKYMSPSKAADTRDTVCRLLYEKLFLWIVEKINVAIKAQGSTPVHWIGLLDIFGFEDFDVNSFEQFCINLTNEQLQRHYTKHTFDKDRQECEKERIDCQSIKYADNQPCLDLIGLPRQSILATLDEISKLDIERVKEDPNNTFLTKITNTYMPDYMSANSQKKKSVLDRQVGELKKPADFFHRGSLDADSFTVRHYAGDVKYNIKNFVEKNNESLKDSLRAVLLCSKDPRMGDMLGASRVTHSGTVASAFRQNLKDLMEMIESTQPQWIRCIRPHSSKRPNLFEPKQVLEQLTAAGVMETVQMRQKNFPFRMKFEEFWRRYSIIVGKKKIGALSANCHRIIESQKIFSDQAQVGTSKVFMLNKAYGVFEKLRGELLKTHTEVVQQYGLYFLAKRKANFCLYKRSCLTIRKIVIFYLLRKKAVREYNARCRRVKLERHSREQMNLSKEEGHFRAGIDAAEKKRNAEVCTEFRVLLRPMLVRVRETLQQHETAKRAQQWGIFVHEREQLFVMRREEEKVAIEAADARLRLRALERHRQRAELEKEAFVILGTISLEQSESYQRLVALWAPIQQDIFQKAERIRRLHAKRERKIERLMTLHRMVQAEEEKFEKRHRREEAEVWREHVGVEQLEEDVATLIGILPPQECHKFLNTFLDHGVPTDVARDPSKSVTGMLQYSQQLRARFQRDTFLEKQRQDREAQRTEAETRRLRGKKLFEEEYYAGPL